ncbi:MAG: folylpolyglutamate synthase/dihydrofolate synthase family protein [Geminicoccaceae bacterium]
MTEFGSDLILARLQQLHPKSIDLSLSRIERLLARLGHPERSLPPVVHIAGTNGKGSTLAMLDAMLTASGRKVHRYISPHLVHFNERILLHGTPIDEHLLADVLDECERANRDEPITFFEITTAAAFLAFGRVEADMLLLETGLGGRLDATNVIDRPRFGLISPISMDHEAYLGNDLRSIASEKAGIIKPGMQVLSGPQTDEVHAVLKQRAADVGAELATLGRDIGFSPGPDGFTLENGRDVRVWPAPRLRGAHQLQNAALAVTAASRLGLDDTAIRRGLEQARWAARLQRITGGPLVDMLPGNVELWLDGGHNPAAGQAIASSLDGIAGGRKVDLVVGMLETKDVDAFLAPLRGRIDRLRFVPVPNETLSRDAAIEAERASRAGWNAAAAAGITEGIAGLVETDDGAARTILVCGSLYLAGHVLRSRK